MIESKKQIQQESLIFEYNKKYDILDIFFGGKIPTFSEELYYGLYNYIDMNTEKIVGISIIDYTKRNKEFIKDLLSFDIDFDYVDKEIYKFN